MQITDKKIEEYCVSKSNRPSEFCLALEEHTRANIQGSQMLIGKMEASFLGFLLRSINATRVLELGTYTGYSALAMAENLPSNGEIITLDINQSTVEVAKSFWAKSPHGSKIVSKLGPALEIIPTLAGEFDLVFIDADKRNYIDYLKLTLPKLSKQGIIVIDNVLWSGKVLPDAELNLDVHYDKNTEYIRQVNDFIAQSEDLYGTLMPIRDGMFLIRKMA